MSGLSCSFSCQRIFKATEEKKLLGVAGTQAEEEEAEEVADKRVVVVVAGVGGSGWAL